MRDDEIINKLIEEYKPAIACIGCAILIIIVPFIYHGYSEYRQKAEDRARVIRNCQKLNELRSEIIRRMDAGEHISSWEAGGAYQIGIMIPEDCTKPLN